MPLLANANPRYHKAALVARSFFKSALAWQYGTSGGTDSTPPGAVPTLASRRLAPSAVQLVWEAATDNVKVIGYNVYRTVSGGTPALIAEKVDALSYFDTTGLSPGSGYYYEVAAVDAAGLVGSRKNTSVGQFQRSDFFGDSYGIALPTTAITGVPAGTTYSQTITSNTFIDTAGATYTRVNFKGRVVVRAANVTFIECFLEGSSTAMTSDDGLINATHSAVSNLVVRDCTFKPQTPSYWVSGILGHDYTVERSLFENCVDGTGIYNTTLTNWTTTSYPANVKVRGCLFINPALWSVPSSRHSDLVSHNDGTQGQGGEGVELIGNAYYGTASNSVGDQNIDPHGQRRTLSGVLQSHQGPLNDWLIYRCWFSDTKFGVTVDGSNAGKTPRGKIIENRFRNHVVAINLDESQRPGWEVLRNTDWNGASVAPTYQTT